MSVGEGKIPKIGVILLAAGESSRMGRDKLTLPLKGNPLILWSLKAFIKAKIQPVLVVTSPKNKRLQSLLQPYPCHLIINPKPEEGRISSLRVGLEALPPEWDGTFIHPGDVPGITPSLILALKEHAWKTQSLTFPWVEGKKGHPICALQAHFSALVQLPEWAPRGVFSHFPHPISPLPWGDPACLWDVDTPEDLKRLSLLQGFPAS